MRILVVIALLIASPTLPGCGASGGGDGNAPARNQGLAAPLLKFGPKVLVPRGPAPSHVVVRVLREGLGRAMRNGEEGAARYVEIDYRTGRVMEQDWKPPNPRRFVVGHHEILPAWETGLKGIRVGGRRELVLPARLAYTPDPVVYVVELMSLRR